jgi:hypothetical protein
MAARGAGAAARDAGDRVSPEPCLLGWGEADSKRKWLEAFGVIAGARMTGIQSWMSASRSLDLLTVFSSHAGSAKLSAAAAVFLRD